MAQRALELRGAADKGARSRKKKALTDLLHALAAAGLSRQRSAVPSVERSVHAWFTQVRPGQHTTSLTSFSKLPFWWTYLVVENVAPCWMWA